MLDTSRRRFLRIGLVGLAAPMIVKASSLMPVRARGPFLWTEPAPSIATMAEWSDLVTDLVCWGSSVVRVTLQGATRVPPDQWPDTLTSDLVVLR